MSGGNDSWEIASDWANEKQVNVPETFRRRRVIEGIELPTLQDKEELMKRGCYLFTAEHKEEEWNQIDQMAYEILHSLIKATKGEATSDKYVAMAYGVAKQFERVRKERNDG